jgi:hypothetical protein
VIFGDLNIYIYIDIGCRVFLSKNRALSIDYCSPKTVLTKWRKFVTKQSRIMLFVTISLKLKVALK